MMRRRAIYFTSFVRCASKIPPVLAVLSADSSLEPSFAGASAASAGATSVACAVVAASKDEEKKDDTYFSSSSLLVTSAMVSWPSGLCAAFPREPTATDTYLHPPSPVASMYLRKAAGIFILFVAHTVTDFIAIVAVFSPLPVSAVA